MLPLLPFPPCTVVCKAGCKSPVYIVGLEEIVGDCVGFSVGDLVGKGVVGALSLLPKHPVTTKLYF